MNYEQKEDFETKYYNSRYITISNKLFYVLLNFIQKKKRLLYYEV